LPVRGSAEKGSSFANWGCKIYRGILFWYHIIKPGNIFPVFKDYPFGERRFLGTLGF
jgi:hypothetical protein